jgi:hypothetical protein
VHETGLILRETLIDNVLYRNLITPRDNRKMQRGAGHAGLIHLLDHPFLHADSFSEG